MTKGKKVGGAEGKRRGSGEGTISYRAGENRYEGRYTVQTAAGPKRNVVYGKTFEETRLKLNPP